MGTGKDIIKVSSVITRDFLGLSEVVGTQWILGVDHVVGTWCKVKIMNFYFLKNFYKKNVCNGQIYV